MGGKKETNRPLGEGQMPRGHYDRKKAKRPRTYASHTQRTQKADTQSAPSQTGFIHGCCNAFVSALMDGGSMEHPDVFIILSDEAALKGYSLEARQQGIRGTFISFRKNL